MKVRPSPWRNSCFISQIFFSKGLSGHGLQGQLNGAQEIVSWQRVREWCGGWDMEGFLRIRPGFVRLEGYESENQSEEEASLCSLKR